MAKYIWVLILGLEVIFPACSGGSETTGNEDVVSKDIIVGTDTVGDANTDVISDIVANDLSSDSAEDTGVDVIVEDLTDISSDISNDVIQEDAILNDIAGEDTYICNCLNKACGEDDGCGNKCIGLCPEGERCNKERFVCEKKIFIPVGAVLYGAIASNTGRPDNCYPVNEAAKFSIIDLSQYLTGKTGRWCGIKERAAFSIKSINPEIILLIYQMSPKELKWLGPRGVLAGQEVYQSLRESNGLESGDPWFAPGYVTNDYLVDMKYPSCMAMDLGNSNWRRYWRERTYDEIWGSNPVFNGESLDGLFVDGSEPSLPYSGFPFCPLSNWDGSNCKDNEQDRPATYWTGTGWNRDKWNTDMLQFARETAEWYHSKGLWVAFNVWQLVPEYLNLLNEVGNGKTVAMEECGFVCPGRFPPAINQWKDRLNYLKNAVNFAIFNLNRIEVDGTGVEKLDLIVYKDLKGWDLLWFAMTSFLLGYDPDKKNGYFHFSAWGYLDCYWLDEYDTRYLNLGDPVGPAKELESGVWEREYELGWVWVNPSEEDKNVVVPEGRVRILNHYNFKDVKNIEPIKEFTLKGWTGVMGLKD